MMTSLVMVSVIVLDMSQLPPQDQALVPWHACLTTDTVAAGADPELLQLEIQQSIELQVELEPVPQPDEAQDDEGVVAVGVSPLLPAMEVTLVEGGLNIPNMPFWQ